METSTPDEWLAMVEDYESGSSLYEIAKRYGVSHQAVHYRLKELGVTLRKTGPVVNADELQKMVSLYEQGWGFLKIAKRFGMSPSGVKYRLHTQGVVIRSKGLQKVPLEEVKAMALQYEQGDTAATIAKRWGMSQRAVHGRLKNYGVTFRPRGTRQKGAVA